MWLLSFPEAVYLDVNEAFVQLFGYPREEVIGRTSLDFGLWADLEHRRLYIQALRDHGRVRNFEFEARTKSGATRSFASSVDVVTMPDGLQVIIGAGIDLTARKETEITLRRSEEQLREADRRKDEFLAMLAHELRNPLAPIRNAVQILRRVSPALAPLERAGEMIDRQVNHLSRLVDDLLDVSRVTQGKITLASGPVDLDQVVVHATEIVRPLIDERGHQLRVTPPPYPRGIRGDFTRLAQVIGNILTNAAKYTDEGGQIELSIAKLGAEVEIRVRDSGSGIAPDLLPHVFDLFTQADRTLDRSHGGLGLGLSLARSLVELHGGHIQAHSEGLGRGSEFVVRLPLDAEVQSHDGASAPCPPGPMPVLRMLVVDDNIDSADSLGLLLEIDGHYVKRAHSGAVALQLALEFKPEVVLLDIGLPGMSGYEVAQRLRAVPGTAHSLLIAITGYGQEQDRRRSRESGFDHHLVKPISAETLGRLIMTLRHRDHSAKS
jgi:PAS domain S-box-containing protein